SPDAFRRNASSIPLARLAKATRTTPAAAADAKSFQRESSGPADSPEAPLRTWGNRAPRSEALRSSADTSRTRFQSFAAWARAPLKAESIRAAADRASSPATGRIQKPFD